MDAYEFDDFVREARRTCAELIIVKQDLHDLAEKYNALITTIEDLQYDITELTAPTPTEET